MMDNLKIKFSKCLNILVLLFIKLLCSYKEYNILIISVYSSLVFTIIKVVPKFFKACNYYYKFFIVNRVVKLKSI